jgi:hypothetical protein
MCALSVRWSAASMTLAALFFGLSLGSVPARAAVSVQVDAASVQVVADQATVSEVLSALSSALGIRYDTTANLDSVIGGTYSGSLDNVLGRILRGYNYVIKTRNATVHVIVIGKVGNFPVGSGASPVELAPAQPATPPNINLETMASRRNR